MVIRGKSILANRVRKWMSTNARESARLEFKLRVNLHSTGAKIEFVRDVIALANSLGEFPREPGYLIIGFRDGERVDVRDDHYDGAKFSQILDAYLWPPLRTVYDEFGDAMCGHVGVLTIFANPATVYSVRKRMKGDDGKVSLYPGQSWGRNTSGKSELDGQEIERRWLEIRNRAVCEAMHPLEQRISHLETQAGPAFEVKRVRFEMEANFEWDSLEIHLRKLFPYAREFDLHVWNEVLAAVSVATARTNRGMTPDIANIVGSILMELLPIGFGGANHHSSKPITEDEQSMLKQIESHTFEMTWDACRYLRSLPIVEVGAGLYWYLVRFTKLNDLHKLQSEFLQNARRCQEKCNEPRDGALFAEGWSSLEERLADALDIP